MLSQFILTRFVAPSSQQPGVFTPKHLESFFSCSFQPKTWLHRGLSMWGPGRPLRIIAGSAFTTAARDTTFPWQRASAKLRWKQNCHGWKFRHPQKRCGKQPWQQCGKIPNLSQIRQKKDVGKSETAIAIIVYRRIRCGKVIYHYSETVFLQIHHFEGFCSKSGPQNPGGFGEWWGCN